MERYEEVLNLWFSGINKNTALSSDHPTIKKWFSKDPAVDQEVVKNFGPDLNKARKGKYDSWLNSPRGRLAMIIVFDQCSRHIYRNTEKAFENDLRALELSLLSIKEGSDEKFSLIERQFLYMPLVHAESSKIQKKSLQCFEGLVKDAEKHDKKNAEYFRGVLEYAKKHHDVVDEFERFPHRNAILNRRSTPAEMDFLTQGSPSV